MKKRKGKVNINNRVKRIPRSIILTVAGIILLEGVQFSVDAIGETVRHKNISKSLESSEGYIKVSEGNSTFFNSINEAINGKSSKMKSSENKEAKMISLYRNATGEIIYLDMEEYVLGVLVAEMGKSFPLEALKAQAVAIRTYAYNFSSAYGNVGSPHANGADLIDTVQNQVYKSPDEYREEYGDSFFDEDWNKLVKAVEDTRDEVIVYNNEIIKNPLFFSSTSGKTEDNIYVFGEDIPYLKPVDSPWDKALASGYYDETTYTTSELNVLLSGEGIVLNDNLSLKSQIKIIERTSTGRPHILEVGGVQITARKLRSYLGLNSTAMSFEFPDSDSVVIYTEGFGHNTGLSQWGAKGMADEGSSYKEILNHYYSGTNIGTLPK